MIIRNWRDVKCTIAHEAGEDWRLLSMPTRTAGDIEVEVDPKFQLLKAITIRFVSQTKIRFKL